MSNSRFPELFARSADIYAAIKAVMARSKEGDDAIDPTEVVTELREHYPATQLSSAELLEEVVRAASEAGVTLKVKSPE